MSDNPREPEQQQWTGTGTPRSADDRPHEEDAPEVDPAVIVGATTSSHPADADEVDINRSGSGGTGGPAVGDET